MKVNPPSAERPEVPPALDAVVMKGLARNAKDRFETAREMATALEAAVHVAIAPTVGAWVEGVAADLLSEQAGRVAEIEHASDISGPVLAAAALPLAQQPKTEPSLRRQELAVSTDTPTMAAQETSVSWPAGLAPGARKRRNVLAGAGAALVVSVVVVVLMQRNASVEPASAAAAGPPPSASIVAHAPTPDPSPFPTPAAVDSTDSTPNSKSSPQPSATKRPPKPPAGTHHAPPASTTPAGYNPLDHL
jgi:eukaryotic-like serine/threonine-protein kinase